MDNIDLLEMAAKSIVIETHGAMRADWLNGHSTYWNPLTDDGDALRLEVDLNLTTKHRFLEILAEENTLCNCDYRKARRRAIVRSAASIGEQMK